ncbi:M56 family metallopeptidase [Kaistella palustris]|uniref:M56 family metallopeptidase n=1 Tax=Kaistella palustris TaxID=493376 RepID=UPI000412F05E|nr:M56 family metallopeptidase [Kaistella palustris]
MGLILLKIIICSGLLLAFYYAILQHEKSFRFNRAFLLGALVFSNAVPFLSIPVPAKSAVKPLLVVGQPILSAEKVAGSQEAAVNWAMIVLLVYLCISAFLLMRFLLSLLKIRLIKGKRLTFQGVEVIVTEKEYIPFSFCNTMFISSKYLHDETVDEGIFLHEKAHILQKHTIDLLFIEFLIIFSWFNPFLFLYKKAVVANHEFLADDFVLRTHFDIHRYQQLILSELENLRALKLTHTFYFNNTKKRFLMMTTNNSRFIGLKKAGSIPLAVLLLLAFAKPLSAQTEIKTKKPDAPVKQALETTPTNAPVLQSVSSEKLPTDRKTVKTDTIRKPSLQKAVEPAIASPPPPPSRFTGILPQFPGGINEFRTLIATNFNTTVLTGFKGLLRTTVFVDIDSEGRMSNIRSEGDNEIFNREAERSLNSIKDQLWTPAQEKGRAVPYVFKLPLTMQFE